MFMNMNRIDILADNVIDFASILQIAHVLITVAQSATNYNDVTIFRSVAFTQGRNSPTLINKVMAASVHDSAFIF